MLREIRCLVVPTVETRNLANSYVKWHSFINNK